ncbi:MAG TPA: hypothetical protein VK611_05170 [Acidimicrobiales bacterium]|nr:hypothetical protein [Acidimicrobiales bacterium]
MSDTPQGPGWWQASDDKWYPPPRPAMPGEEPAATQVVGPPPAPAPGAMPGSVAPPFGAPPGAPPTSGGYPSAPPTAPVPGPPPLSGQPSNPYGMPPGTPPPGVGDNNRTPLFVVLGILGAAAVVLLFFLLSSGDDGGDPQNPSDRTTLPPSTDTPDTEPTDTTDPGDDPPPANDGPVQVVDQGFSNFEGTSGDSAGSFGFILENTGDDILQSVETQVVIYGSGDRVITTKDFSIGTIRPGEQMGFGDEMYGEDVQDGIDHLEVQVRDHSDAAADPADVPDGGFEITGTETTNDEYNMTTSFHLVSTYTVEEVGYPSTYVVFRDAGGDIVGGAWGSAAFESAPEADVEVTTYDVIPDVDTTEVFVDPGYVYTSP